MKRKFAKMILAFGLSVLCAQNSFSAISTEEFENPPMEFRPYPLWFWTGKIELDCVKERMLEMKRLGYGGAAIIPFFADFKPEYLGAEYFELYRQTLLFAKELGFKMSLYDEYAFPSGNAGGSSLADNVARFKNAYPADTLKKLVKVETPLKNGESIRYTRRTRGVLMALVAVDFADSLDESGRQKQKELEGVGNAKMESVALSEKLEDGVLNWTVPQSGNWRMIEFACAETAEANVDYLSYESCVKFTDFVHRKYFDKMGALFGSVIKTAFFDEPTLYRLDGLVWTPAFNEKFKAAHGYSPEKMYPALWYGMGAYTASYRNALFGFRAELYAGGFMKALNDWCSAHGIKLTGHQDNEEIVNCVGTSADLMKTFKYQEIAGIDKIGGARPAEMFYKLVSSAAYNFDRGLVMSETFGAMPNLPESLMYEIALDQYAKGVNILIPHAVWFQKKRVVFPPDLGATHSYYSEKIAPLNRFLSRLNLAMQNSDRVWQNIAVYYPIETMQTAHRFGGPLGAYEGGVQIPEANYHKVGALLSENLGRDYMFIHPDILDQKCEVRGGKMALKNKTQFNDFDILIMPAVSTISLKNYEKILGFAKSGGAVLFIGSRMPYKSSDSASEDSRIAQISAEICKLENVLHLDGAYQNQIGEFINCHAPAPAEFYAQSLKYIRKIKPDGKSLYLAANLSGKNYCADIAFAGANFRILNPHSGKVYSPENPTRFKNKNGEVMERFFAEIPSGQGLIFEEL